MLVWGCFSLWEARSPPPPLSLPPSARAANGACAEPRGRLRAAMAPAAGCGRVAAVSCLVLCASLLLPRALLPRGGGRTEPGAAPPDGKSPLRAAAARMGLPGATRGCPGLPGAEGPPAEGAERGSTFRASPGPAPGFLGPSLSQQVVRGVGVVFCVSSPSACCQRCRKPTFPCGVSFQGFILLLLERCRGFRKK